MGNSNGNHTTRLVVIENDKNARDYVKRSLGNSVRVVGEAEDLGAGMHLIRGLQPDMVLLELPVNATQTLESVKQIREEQPATSFIVSTHAPSPQLILSCMRAGAQEFVGHPIDAPELEKAIQRLQELMVKTVVRNKRSGKVLSVFSSKGGVGASSIAANLGVALAGRDSRTVLVDLSFQIGDLGLMLDSPPQYSLTDAFDAGRIDESRLRSITSQHPCGVDIITVAASPEIGEEIGREHMVELFGTLSTLYDYVVVDVGRQFDDRAVEVLDMSDGILMVTCQDIPTNRNVSRYIDMFQRLEFNRDKVHLIINRYHKKSRLSVEDIEKALGLEVFWSIPNDFAPMSLGIDSGNPAVLEVPKSKVAQSFRDLAEALCQEYEDRPASETVQAASN